MALMDFARPEGFVLSVPIGNTQNVIFNNLFSSSI
jgi:hypothetical protein